MAKRKPERRYGSGSLNWETDRWRARSIPVGGRSVAKIFRPTSSTPAAKRAAKQEAHRWLDTFLVEQGTQAGRRGERAGLTLNQWTASWLTMFGEKVTAGLKARRTLVSYRKDLDLYVLPTLGQVRLGDLTGEHVERWLTRLAGTPSRMGGQLKDATVVRAYRTLHKVYSDARLGRNPCDEVERPRIRDRDRPEMATWEPEQTNMFLAHTATCERAGGTRLYPLWVVAARTGLRRGELSGLRWGDIDLDAGLITVRVAIGTDGGELYPVPRPKGRKHRVVDADPVVVAALRQRKATQDLEQAGTWNPDLRFGPLVFTTADGQPVDPNRLSRWFPAHIRHLDGALPHTTLHRLRHAYGSALLTAGVPLADVARRLGHSQQVLESTYAKELDVLRDQSRAQVLDAHQRLWGGTG